MARTMVDFSNIIDGTAGGGTGDNTLQAGDLVFTIAAQGNWTAGFANGRFNFQEDAAVGGENFTITITSATGQNIDFYDYQFSVDANPSYVGSWPANVAIGSLGISDDNLHGNGIGPYTYSGLFGTEIAVAPAASFIIRDLDIYETDYSGRMTIWLDNISVESVPNPNPNLVPSLTATGGPRIFTENDAAVDLFSGVTAATNNTGQTFVGMTLTVSNVSGIGERLTIGGTAVVLTNGTSGTVGTGGNYAVVVSGGTATITLSGMALSNSAMGTLVDGMGFSIAGDNPDASSRTVTITSVTDSGGTNNLTSTSIGAIVTVVPINDAPVVANAISNQIAIEDSAFNFQFASNAFNDAEGATLTYSAQLAGGGSLPGWLTFDPTTRTFSGTPANGDVGSISIDVVAADGHGGSVTDTFDIVIANSNDAPTLANQIADQTATEDSAFNFQFAANVFNDIDLGDTLTYSAQLAGGGALPAWLSFDPATRTFSGTPLNGDIGTISIDVVASDGSGGTVADTFAIVVGNTNDGPAVANAIPDQNATEDAAFNFQFASNTFADDDGDILTYTAQLAGGGSLPSWLAFDAATRTFSGTPENGDVGTIHIEVVASDQNGGSVTDIFNLGVGNTNDGPVAGDDAGALAEDQAVAFDVLANDSDPDVGDTLSILNPVVTSANATATVDGDGNLLVTYTGESLDEGEIGEIVVTYEASDGEASDSATLTVTVTGVYDTGDDITGSDAGETITGSEQGETITAGGGNDTVKGLGGDDEISGGSGRDIIDGGDGDDTLRSGSGADRIIGGLGNDYIAGWGGNDRMTGGEGSDVFIFHRNDGRDVITDFDVRGADHDRIDLSALPRFDAWRDVRDVMEMQGGDTIINTGANNSIRLNDVDMSDLSREHFIF
jgi:Ca2+-binding RTX toxin-like protein